MAVARGPEAVEIKTGEVSAGEDVILVKRITATETTLELRLADADAVNQAYIPLSRSEAVRFIAALRQLAAAPTAATPSPVTRCQSALTTTTCEQWLLAPLDPEMRAIPRLRVY